MENTTWLALLAHVWCDETEDGTVEEEDTKMPAMGGGQACSNRIYNKQILINKGGK